MHVTWTREKRARRVYDTCECDLYCKRWRVEKIRETKSRSLIRIGSPRPDPKGRALELDESLGGGPVQHRSHTGPWQNVAAPRHPRRPHCALRSCSTAATSPSLVHDDSATQPTVRALLSPGRLDSEHPLLSSDFNQTKKRLAFGFWEKLECGKVGSRKTHGRSRVRSPPDSVAVPIMPDL